MPRSTLHKRSDGELIALVRDGRSDAYGELWSRHAAAAGVAARAYGKPGEAEDMVAEAYLKILEAIRNGKGPTGAFRPYLYTVVRNQGRTAAWSDAPVHVEDFDLYVDPDSEVDPSQVFEKSAALRAFRALPERWQTVLWYVEVEKFKPREIAPLMGMSANATSALVIRAREGLRRAWLQEHVSSAGLPDACVRTIESFGALERDAIRAGDRALLEAHLRECAHCTIVLAELRDTTSRLPALIAPFFLGGLPLGALASGLHSDPGVTATLASPRGWGSVPVAGKAGIGAATVSAATALGIAVTFALGAPAPVETSVAAPPAATDTEPVVEVFEPEDPIVVPPETVDPPAPPAPPTRPEAVLPTIPVVPADPAAEPELPVDTTAAAPVVESVIDDGSGARFNLYGTAEPFATVTVRDVYGNTYGVGSADGLGSWSTARLDTFAPTLTELYVTQVDLAGNQSVATVLGPFAFRPRMAETTAITCAVGDNILIEVYGWSDTYVSLNLGQGTGSTLQPVVDGVATFAIVCSGPTGVFDITATMNGSTRSVPRSLTVV